MTSTITDSLPLVFKWGTFCKQILVHEGTQERSLIGVQQSINIDLPEGVLEFPRKQGVQHFELNLGAYNVYMSFARREGMAGPINFAVQGVSNILNAPPDFTVPLIMEPIHNFSQICLEIPTFAVRIPLTTGIHKFQNYFALYANKVEFAKVSVPITVTVR
jgi:hypothetical protein